MTDLDLEAVLDSTGYRNIPEDLSALVAEVRRLREENKRLHQFAGWCRDVQIPKLTEAVNRPHERGPDDDGVRYCEACHWAWPCRPSRGERNPGSQPDSLTR